MTSLKSNTFKNLPSGVQEAVFNRSKVEAAIYNTNVYIKDIKSAKKWAKGMEDEQSILSGLLHDLNNVYENELIPVKNLADDYYEIIGEKYYKTLSKAEKMLNI